MRAVAVSFGGFLACTTVLIGLMVVGVAGRELVQWLCLVSLVVAIVIFLELSRAARPPLRWRELQRNDAVQVLAFPELYFLGWRDVLAGHLAGWRAVLLAAGITTVVCVVAYEFVLRIPPVVADFRRRRSKR